MPKQHSVAVQNAMLDAKETAISTAPKLQIRTGAAPANCAAADSGTLLAELPLPSDWLAAASGGVKSKSGTWSGTGSAAGNAGHYRIKDTAGTTCHEQGTITATGGGGDMTMDNISVAVSQAITVNTYSNTAANQ